MIQKPAFPVRVVDIVAPASPVSLRQVKEACLRVRALGLYPRLLMNPEAKKQFLFSDTDERRFFFLKKALMASDSQAVWALRGGWGSGRLMPFFLKMKRPKTAKLFIGYSDVSTLKMFLNLKWNWPTLHFPVLADWEGRLQVRKKPQVRQEFPHGLCPSLSCFKGLRVLNPSHHRSSFVIQGRMTGGNLSLVQNALATPWAFSFKNRILFLEETGEKAYRIDRMLYQMRIAGLFKGIKALVLGDFIYLKSKTLVQKNHIQEVLRGFAQEMRVPVLSGLPIGHQHKNKALPFFTPAKIELLRGQNKATLSVKSPYCYQV